ncbi:MAG TPA: cobyric acid synthase [Bryobacteraceae bacterium]|nr:cobyric acid synthase [Bryobacteraceae bacterium]
MPGPLFIGGTASHAGKSWFTAAFCSLLRRRGVRVAPFKAQNMSNNSFPCIEGGEIGRAQAMQAEACGLPPMADMNPVLLKPHSSTGSQVIRLGKVWRNVEARDYYEHAADLMEIALGGFARLASQFDFVVCEGAGSVAEVNLFERDFTNLRFAQAVAAKTLLVADIERGGVFGSLVGTMDLLPAGQRELVRAFAVNRFRGDPRLFEGGVAFLEKRLGIPCLGVFPFLPDLRLDEEDSVAISGSAPDDGAPVAVIRLPRISNFTDFRLFPRIAWIDKPGAGNFQAIFLPGTKNTIEDLNWLRERGLSEWLIGQHRGGARIVGVCGGYQMLGAFIDDPDHLESSLGRVEGLGLLPVGTVLRSPKVTTVVRASVAGLDQVPAYEIHMGRTEMLEAIAPFAHLADGRPEGACAGRVMGTYLHGIFEHPEVVRRTLGIDLPPVPEKLATYGLLAQWLVEHSKAPVLEDLLA